MKISSLWIIRITLPLFFSILNFYYCPVSLCASENTIPAQSRSLTGTLYHAEIPSASAHYYHLQAAQKKAQLIVKSEHLSSCSFCLYSKKGIEKQNISQKIFSGKIVTTYLLSPGQFYLFRLNNQTKNEISYSIFLKYPPSRKSSFLTRSDSQKSKTKKKDAFKTIRKPRSGPLPDKNSDTEPKAAQRTTAEKKTAVTKRKKQIKTERKSRTVPSLKLSRSFLLLQKSQKARLTVRILPAAVRKSASRLQWVSADNSIVSVTSGRLKGKRTGITTVSCYFIFQNKKYAASCTIKVA